jgi:hypothetical protein
MWCLRCYEPVRHLSPRPAPLPTDLVSIDPTLRRRDQTWERLDKPVYSRVRAGSTTFGLWGRLGLTSFLFLFLPWGSFTFISVLYLVGYLPIAGFLLAAIWRKDLVGSAPADAITVTPPFTRHVWVAAVTTGIAILGAAAASHAGPLGYAPAGLILGVALFRPTTGFVCEAIHEAQVRPIGALILLNGLNVLDMIMTDAAIGMGVGRELNPLVIAMGPFPKLVLVGICSGLLMWRRPTALVWPTLVFLALTAYHLTGLLGNLALS